MRIIIASVLMLASAAASAHDWQPAAEAAAEHHDGKNGRPGWTKQMLWAVDVSSIRLRDGFRYAWVRGTENSLADDATIPTVIEYALQYSRYDCAETRYQILQMQIYDAEDHMIQPDNGRPGNWSYVTPDTVGESQLQFVCSRKL